MATTNKFNDLVSELNEYDYSIGLSPIGQFNEELARDILESWNVDILNVEASNVVFQCNGQQYEIFNDTEKDQWNIREYFDMNEIKEDVLKALNELNKETKCLEVFGQLLEGVPNYMRLVKNKKYDTYYIDMYIGNNKLEYNGLYNELVTNINNWFDGLQIR